MKPYTSTTPIALVLADVDGTLVTQQKVLTPRAIDAVARLRARGIHFAITSGRPPRGMAMVNDALHLNTPIAGFNGGVFVTPGGAVLQTKILPRDAAEKAIELIHSHDLIAWLYTPDAWYIPDPNGPHVARETWTVKFEAKICADYGSLLDQAVKIVGVARDEPENCVNCPSDDSASHNHPAPAGSDRAKALESVVKCEAACRAAIGSIVSAARSQPYYLDITHPDATKGGVVDYLSRALNIPAQAIATLGDMPNDVSMFEKSGMSIAMGNASAEVQAQANFVTDSNENEGFAKAIDEFILRV